ncbi:hypothetical protein [Phosphitispora fastidiosa]|uniref:hypothetical protein n=1 Tax=Phosphitispora fastidiosa TaxID=2837202 RepID=UPI001E3AE650|nr:hypothetical protein [Phosphitispora fastidiosa]MBU7006190.1 3-dehydroquinate dehydratase [Phosphitispora fastidiosa]
MFNSQLKKTAISSFEASVERYKQLAEKTQILSSELMLERQKSVQAIVNVERFVNSLANTEKIFDKDLGQIEVFVSQFKEASEFKAESINAAKVGGGIAGVGAATSIGVAAFGPTAAMAVATTFGTASTGAAISSLSGAAATNAALAWLGGGALAAGGGGMSAGTALLGLAGPIGWTIGGVALIGSASFAFIKNKKIADKAHAEKAKVEEIIRKFTGFNNEIIEIKDLTITHTEGLSKSLDAISALNKQNYLDYTSDEKLALGALVNNTLSLAKLLDRTVKTY